MDTPSSPSHKDSILTDALSRSGAVAWGITKAEPLTQSAAEAFHKWIADRKHAGMDYMESNIDLRLDPAQLLPGAKSIISLAFSYWHPQQQKPESPKVAMYAHGSDYHNVLRKRLRPIVSQLRDTLGGDWRICIDSAPVAERYWAVRASVGKIGRNSQLIVPGHGSYCFLATIITDQKFASGCSLPNGLSTIQTFELQHQPFIESYFADCCIDCNRCVNACPGRAIDSTTRSVDARRCISYLTIEGGRLDVPASIPADIRLGNRLLGCDTCQQVCPANASPIAASLPQFSLRDEIRDLTGEQLMDMSPEQFDSIFAGSPIRRAPLHHLQSILRINRR